MLKTIYRNVHINCNSTMGCLNILDRKLFHINLYENGRGRFDVNFKKTLYFPSISKRAVENPIVIKRTDNQKDFCIHSLSYFGNGLRFFISHDRSTALYSPLSFDSEISDDDDIFNSYQSLPSSICASHLSAHPEEVDSIFLWFESSDQYDGLEYIADITVDYPKLQKVLNSFNLDELKKEDFIPYDGNYISFNETGKSFGIGFSPFDRNGTTSFETRLTSKFINLNQIIAIDTFQIDFAFRKFIGNWTDYGDVFIEFRPSSEDQKSYSIKVKFKIKMFEKIFNVFFHFDNLNTGIEIKSSEYIDL
mgnify:CR=1 FL=1